VRRLTESDGLSDRHVMALAEGAEGLWIATERGGVDLFADDRVARTIGPAQGLAHPRVWSLGADGDGNLWIGTDGGGLQRLSHGRLDSFSTRNGLGNDFVWAIHEDREGSLWVGTNGGGLTRLKNGSVVPLTRREGLPSDFVWTVTRTHDDSLWVGTDDAGVVRLHAGTTTRYGDAQGLHGSIRALCERRDGSLWIGTLSGLYTLRDGRVATALPAMPGLTASALAEDASGALWACGERYGLVRVRDEQAEVVDAREPLCKALLPAHDGALWVGSIAGVTRRAADGSERHWSTAEGLPSAYVTALFEDADGDVWAATRGGLARLHGGTVAAITSRQGLPDDEIMSAQLDDDDAVWMGSNRGLFRVPRWQLAAVAAGRRAGVDALTFGLEDGMRSVEVNASSAASTRDADGRLWFATRVGAASVDPRHLPSDHVPPSVVIEEVLADGHRLPGRGPWRLRPGTQRVEFHFTALSLLDPTRVRLRHRLEGFDDEWVASGPERKAEYTNLRPGRYRFRVVAANADGAWNTVGDRVELALAPRWFESLWFRLTLGFVFLLAGPLVYLLRVHRLSRQTRQLEELVAERTAEVEAANARLAQLARVDGLTGVFNRRAFDEALSVEWRRAVRASTPLALLLLDVDLFKPYNDDQGHPAGDECLIAVAGALAQAFQRAGDSVARYGGEELAVLLPGASAEQAASAAENVRRLVEELAIPHPTSNVAPVVTVSIGVGWCEPTPDGAAVDLLRVADRALYAAKQGGRNRIECRVLETAEPVAGS
jgi:diguanylate cyclase (GGDEF)-like protein